MAHVRPQARTSPTWIGDWINMGPCINARFLTHHSHQNTSAAGFDGEWTLQENYSEVPGDAGIKMDSAGKKLLQKGY